MLIRTIKVYLGKKKQKKRLQKLINHEILETLASICLYLDSEGRRTGNPRARGFNSHFHTLKEYSEILRKEIMPEDAE